MAFALTYPEGAALVSGGTGRVGEGTVRRLAQAGVPTVFTYNSNADKAQELEAELRGEGHEVHAVPMALTDGASIDAAIARAVEAGGGRMHGIAWGGGPMVPFGRMADLSEDALKHYLDVDALGAHRLFSRGVKLMRETGGGSLVACTTIANYQVVDFDGASPYSKATVEAMVRQIAAEEAEHGIRCNAVPISWVFDVDAEEQIAQLSEVPEPTRNLMVAIIRQMAAGTRVGRPATILEAGNLFAFLLSNEASYITGQSIRLDGGFSL